MSDIRKVIPTPNAQELEERTQKYIRTRYTEEQLNPNNFINWGPSLCGRFRSPRSRYLLLSLERFTWLGSDNYDDVGILDLGQWLKGEAEKLHAEGVPYPMFLKGSTFSNKFEFSNCIITQDMSAMDLGRNALNMYYAGIMGDRCDAGFVIREFIDPDNTLPKIYSGLPLHVEFRIFYDFRSHRVVGTSPYWEQNTMRHGLHEAGDQEVFASELPRLEQGYKANLQRVVNMVNEALQDMAQAPNPEWTADIWSLDFMVDTNDEVWFIDAAVGFLSYFYEQLPEEFRKSDMRCMSEKTRLLIANS